MTRRKALIKALIHFHYRSGLGGWRGLHRNSQAIKDLRTKIAEPDQYGIDR